ncbi:ankyrin repeat protein [Cercophora scortea]|uniref:Ankyrin repeat protein n=1 Tax=Cercophora scortea TaxID=314031 RepID=A0AAE0IWX6_9PEZI|nr:ankyrin repeat protein [Cercophora scortea]
MNSKRPLQDDEVSDTSHPKRPKTFDIVSHGSHGGVPLGSDHYTVGWIAALPIERAAATALLDERHHESQGFSQNPSDTNSYTWGRMGEHNIVTASLPAGVYGTTSAATNASNLLSSLPQIGLLVGIGGGIARPDKGMDIRLGDVVVSQPEGATGGVVQYDLVKAKSGGERERKDFLNIPPPVLLHALANLRAEHEAEEPMMNEFLSKMLRDKPRMAKSGPGYIHMGGCDCRGCDPNRKVPRVVRDSTDPKIHYGIIASGNTLVKDAAERDEVAKHVGEQCLCVEMEAAGLINHHPCLVIRGICDYADSHKNDRWQRYASATAAAFGKELLSYVPASDPQKTRRAAKPVLRAG